MNKIGVVLSGCGVKDGTEIHEAVLTLLYLDQTGAEIICMAPDIPQRVVINHLSGEEMNEQRNVLIESARIARGNIKNIKDVDPNELDAVIFPGGFGAALNLSSFGKEGISCTVNHEIGKLIKDMHSLGKPLGFLCIAPAVAAKVLGGLELKNKVRLTIGSDKGTADAIHQLNAIHESKTVDDICVDLENKVVSTPAYMVGPGVKNIAKGIEKLVHEIMALVNSGRVTTHSDKQHLVV